MPRLLWLVVVVGAFSAGLSTSWWQHQPDLRPPTVQHSMASDAPQQIAVLQQHIQTQEMALAALRQHVQTLSSVQPVAVPPRPAVATATPPAESQEVRRPPRLERLQETSARPDAAEVPATATEEEVRRRVQQYLAETEGLSLAARRQRWRALGEELRELGEPALTALLQELEGDGGAQARRTAATLLGALQDVRALPALQEVLERDADLLMRRAATQGLRLLQHPETIPVLATLLHNTQEDRFVRLSAAYGLAQLGDGQGVRGLAQIFDEAAEDGQGRMLAFRSLMALSDPAALPLMRQLTVSDADVSYRLAAMRFLAEQGDQAALPLLQQVFHSPHEQPSVVEAAARAHAAITSGQVPARNRGERTSIDTEDTGTTAPKRRR